MFEAPAGLSRAIGHLVVAPRLYGAVFHAFLREAHDEYKKAEVKPEGLLSQLSLAQEDVHSGLLSNHSHMRRSPAC